MQVMVRCESEEVHAGLSVRLSAVAFDMDGRIADPHELLQAEDCWFDGVSLGYDSCCALAEKFDRFVRARLGKKGGLWAESPTLEFASVAHLFGQSLMPCPWADGQERDLRTLLAMVRKLGPVKLPEMDTTGLVPGRLLHDAVRQAVIVQAAYKALGLSAGNHARAEQSRASAS